MPRHQMRSDPIYAQVGPFEAFRSTDTALRALLSTYREWEGEIVRVWPAVDFLDVPTRQIFTLFLSPSSATVFPVHSWILVIFGLMVEF